ncbi:MAG: hypothetical protein KAT46_03415 [Deltaproteobacteria bacterium]|nr:hypothetical protein [Deltaproteobacteria bacterium]
MTFEIPSLGLNYADSALGAMSDLFTIALALAIFTIGGFMGRRFRGRWKGLILTALIAVALAFGGGLITKKLEKNTNTIRINLKNKQVLTEKNLRLFFVLLIPGVYGVFRRYK